MSGLEAVRKDGADRSGADSSLIESSEALREAELTQEFLGISREQFASISSRIRSCKGHVRIAVHPFYIDRYPGSYETRKRSDTAGEAHEFLAQGLERAVKNVSTQGTSAPLFVFEERRHAADTKASLAELAATLPEELADKGILLATTVEGGGLLSEEGSCLAYEKLFPPPPGKAYVELKQRDEYLRKHIADMRPVLKPEGYTYENGAAIASLDFLKGLEAEKPFTMERDAIFNEISRRREFVLRSMCRTLGITSALISGAYFNENSSKSNPGIGGCAGTVVNELRAAGVLTDISRYSSMTRKEIGNTGFETKQTGSKAA